MSRASSVEEIRERPLTQDEFVTAVQYIFSHVDAKDGRLAECETCGDLVARMRKSHAYLLEIAEAAREVVAERDDLGMAVEDEDGLWDAIDRLRDALEAENE